ncbi:MAG: DUF4091 domain-containing protein [Clostridia bacterium]|nr:DUF4091 domain-containing protein [Clostridia bacterium]
MKKFTLILLAALTAAVFAVSSAASSAHELTEAEQNSAAELLASAVDRAPQIPNEPVRAEAEDEGTALWFEHSYVKVPAENVTPNGRNSYQIRLAKNEIECVWLILAPSEDKTVTVTVSDFINEGTAITPRVYYGFYFDDVAGESTIDPIPPLDGPIELHAGRSQAFLIKVKTEKDTPAGQYKASVSVKDADGKEIKRADVYAYVWDFALPDSSHVKTLADLGWWAIYAADPALYSGDDGAAYKFYYDTLLENKVNAYSMPELLGGDYGALDGDTLATVTAYLDDPRVQAFNPLGWKTALSEENIRSAYEFLSQKPEWLAKAYFYPDSNDEPMSRAQLNSVIDNANLIKSVWENYKLIIPMHWNDLIDSKTGEDHFEYLKDYVTVWCPHTFFFNTIADQKADKRLTVRVKTKTERNYGTFPERMAQRQAEGNEVWWYVTRFPQTPEIALSMSDPEVNHRILFWQQKLYNVDGFLYYAVNDWYGAGASQHNWGWDKKHEVDTGTINPFDYYGNGVLLYHGGYIGRLHECVESIRLESIRDGVEDYDYFDLLDAKYGEGKSTLVIKQITTSLGSYKSDPELFNTIRLAVGNLIAPDPWPETVDTDEATDTEPSPVTTDADTEPAGEKGVSPLVWIIPAAAAAIAAAVIAAVVIRKKK